jgi:tricorn protease-like protein
MLNTDYFMIAGLKNNKVLVFVLNKRGGTLLS